MNELFKDYAKHHPGINYQFSKQEYEAVSRGYYKIYGEFLPKDKNAKILDLGCGIGHFLYLLKKLGYQDYFGVDLSKESTEFSRTITKKVRDIDCFDFLKNSKNKYDLIIMNDLIEHIPKEKIFLLLDLCCKKLSSKGKLIVKTPNMDNPFCVYTRFHDFTHEIGFNGNSLIQVLKMSGFEEVSIYPYEAKNKRDIRCMIKKFVRKIIWRLISIGFSFPKEKNNYRIIHTKHIFAVAKKTS